MSSPEDILKEQTTGSVETKEAPPKGCLSVHHAKKSVIEACNALLIYNAFIAPFWKSSTLLFFILEPAGGKVH